MEQLDDHWVDILTGHASARFKWIDARSSDEWQKQPPPPGITHIPLSDLRARASTEFKRDAELVVYGSSDAETAEAERTLAKLGFLNVLAFHGGFATLGKLFR